jgi:hypothetical protein
LRLPLALIGGPQRLRAAVLPVSAHVVVNRGDGKGGAGGAEVGHVDGEQGVAADARAADGSDDEIDVIQPTTERGEQRGGEAATAQHVGIGVFCAGALVVARDFEVAGIVQQDSGKRQLDLSG